MKRLLASVAFLLALSSTASALTFPTEHFWGYNDTTRGLIKYAYDIGYSDNALRVDVDVYLYGAKPVQTLLTRWETGIESIWSTVDRFAVPILFNVDWTSAIDADHYVRVVDGAGRWNSGTFYTVGAAGWGDAYIEEAAAHEFGHLIGLADEYVSGGLDRDTMAVNTGGLMDTLNGTTLDTYYSEFIGWYDDHKWYYDLTHGETEPVPEPSTVALWLVGLVGVVVAKKRQAV